MKSLANQQRAAKFLDPRAVPQPAHKNQLCIARAVSCAVPIHRPTTQTKRNKNNCLQRADQETSPLSSFLGDNFLMLNVIVYFEPFSERPFADHALIHFSRLLKQIQVLVVCATVVSGGPKSCTLHRTPHSTQTKWGREPIFHPEQVGSSILG